MRLSLNHRIRERSRKAGFTIVELIVVLVVMSILAAMIIVSYIGINERAIAAALQTDLNNASKTLQLYYAEHDSYPTSMEDGDGNGSYCPSGPVIDDKYCIGSSDSDTSFEYTPSATDFSLTASNGSITYVTTSTTPPTPLLGNSITAIADITGTVATSQTLTAGALTPSEATATYQWQSAAASDGPYADISGATSTTFVISPRYIGKYFKVVATGTGDYSGSATSAASSQVAADANWLTIGTQTWSKTNVNVGTRIGVASNQTNNAVVEKYCYNDNEANCTSLGAFYQWGEAMQYSTAEGARGICPAGTHIPSDNEWKILEMQLGMSQAQADGTNFRGTDQGTQLKPGGTSGLNMALVGYRYNSPGMSFGNGTFLYLWSSTQSGSNAYDRGLSSTDARVFRYADAKSFGFSVRCLGD